MESNADWQPAIKSNYYLRLSDYLILSNIYPYMIPSYKLICAQLQRRS